MNFPVVFLLIFVAFFAPFVIWAVRIRLNATRLARAGITSGAPFENAVPETAPNLFLRHFNQPERAYLRQQWRSAKAMYLGVAWVTFMLLSPSLLLSFISHQNNELRSAVVLEHYLLGFSVFCRFSGIVIFFSALVATSQLTAIHFGRFTRTRPFSLRFLYRVHIGSTLMALCAGLLTGAVLSFLLLLALYGPVWRHLPHDAARLAVLCVCPNDMHAIRTALQSSLPRLILSLVTTGTLAFSLAVAFFLQPLKFLQKPILTFLTLVFLVLLCSLYDLWGNTRIVRLLFLYLKPGPPPPYVFALIPLAISAVLLWLAERFATRLEV